MKTVLITFCMAVAAFTNLGAQPLVISADRVLSEGGFPLDRGWKYHAGDDPAWAAPDLDDERWTSLPSGVVTPPGDFDARRHIGWFRIRIEVPPRLRDSLTGLALSGLGAIELYLDGQRVREFGRVDPTGAETNEFLSERPLVSTVALDDRSVHTIAVRFATGNRPNYRFPRHPVAGIGGFTITMARPEAVLTANSRRSFRHTSLHTIAAAAAMTIAILHLFLFAFYPRRTAHLYYALFTMFAAMIAYVPVMFMRTHDLHEFALWARVMHVSLVLVSVMGIRFLYAIFYDRMPRFFWLWLGAGAVFTVVLWNGPVTNVFFFTLATFVEIFRVLVTAVIRRKPYAGLITIGVAAFILSSAFEILGELLRHPVGGAQREETGLYLFGMLAMLIIMSVAMALGFAKINRDLALKFAEVEKLSAERLEQERRAKEQEMERMRLEADNALKAAELEAAHKRQEVLDELATTNRELRQTQSQLVQSEKMAALGNLVAGVAHEINTPVGAISSMHDTLARAVGRLKKSMATDDKNLELERTIKIIEDANAVIDTGSGRVTTIVRRLRSFARLDEAELQKADIHEGLEDTLTLVHHELKHHVTVHRNYGKIPEIACYPGQLNQVFLNLLVNAKQAIEGDGDITITTMQKGDKVHVEFADTGRGIPEAHLAKVFDPGFTTKGVGVGTGLGLSICYRIIQEHKGEILVESKEGEGTIFTVVLPMDLE